MTASSLTRMTGFDMGFEKPKGFLNAEAVSEAFSDQAEWYFEDDQTGKSWDICRLSSSTLKSTTSSSRASSRVEHLGRIEPCRGEQAINTLYRPIAVFSTTKEFKMVQFVNVVTSGSWMSNSILRQLHGNFTMSLTTILRNILKRTYNLETTSH